MSGKLISPHVVQQWQVAWERGLEALAMREYGMTYETIGKHYGVTRERARQMVAKAERMRRWGQGQPIERWGEL